MNKSKISLKEISELENEGLVLLNKVTKLFREHYYDQPNEKIKTDLEKLRKHINNTFQKLRDIRWEIET